MELRELQNPMRGGELGGYNFDVQDGGLQGPLI
jgi:hypothetical protein